MDTAPLQGWICMPEGEGTHNLALVTESSLISQGQNMVGLQVYITEEDLRIPFFPRKTKSPR